MKGKIELVETSEFYVHYYTHKDGKAFNNKIPLAKADYQEVITFGLAYKESINFNIIDSKIHGSIAKLT